jgi:ATP-dependent RNA helicase HelY
VADYARRRREEQRDRHSGDLLSDRLHQLKPGDVVWLQGGKSAGPAAVLSVSHRKGGAVRVRVVTPRRRVLNLGSADFDDPPEVVGNVELPTPFEPRSHAFQRAVAQALHRLDVRRPQRQAVSDAASSEGVERCPDLSDHLRALADLERVETEVESLKRSVRGHSESLARQFDRVLQLLESWGHLDGWSLTRRGDQLVRIYHECDLLVAEALETGVLDGLDAASLAGVVSCFTYEHRTSTPTPDPWFPSAEVEHRFVQLEYLATELNADERRLRLPITRGPDPGLFALAHAWAAGDELDDVLADSDLSGGDFVRNMKQLLDLLRQLGDAAGHPTTAAAARAAADAIFRGIVAASSAVSVEGNEGEGVDDDVAEPVP